VERMQIEKLRAAPRDPLRIRRERYVTSYLVVLVRSPELSEFIAAFLSFGRRSAFCRVLNVSIHSRRRAAAPAPSAIFMVRRQRLARNARILHQPCRLMATQS
jgi:hypothetical protein